jgi:tRNA A-37 threonylcarbamoyl transferase component Bud32/tetratricopeptide (TPR) repeat protein
MASISHYDVIGPLGEGGMGEVFVAFDTTLQRKVALKAVRHEHRLDDVARARLLREARILSQLDHPNICRIYDFVSDGASDYLVLELIEGRSLRSALRDGLDRAARMRAAEEIARALVVAHASGIVHRDLKPENVMVLADGHIKVLDFGLARAFEDAAVDRPGSPAAIVAALDDSAITMLPAGSSQSPASNMSTVHTAVGALMGSPVYMSPEQARGEPSTTASDMFAFGLLLQELVTGRRPYDTALSTAAILEARSRGVTLDATDAPRELGALISRLKALAPSARPTAVDTVDWLRRVREAPARRMRYAAVAVLVLAILGAGVKYSIDVTRERTAAVIAREDAVRRRGQAEALIGFMLGDLRPKLQRVGRLDLLDDIGQQAMDYFAAVPPSSITNEELSRRSQALYQIGQVKQARGDVSAAVIAYGESLKLARELVARNPANADWQFGLAQSYFYAGNVRRIQGDLDGAMQHFEAYRDIARQQATTSPSDPKWVLELAFGHSNVAAIHEARGDLERARDALIASSQVRQALVKLDPRRREWREAAATAHNRLGVVFERLGDAGPALDQYRQDVEMRRALAAEQPGDRVTQERLSVAIAFLSHVLRDNGDDQSALALSRERLAICEALVAHDAANTAWQRELAAAELRLAADDRSRGRLDAADRRARRAAALLESLALKNPTEILRQRDLGQASVELALIALAAGRASEAATFASAAAERLQAVTQKTPRDSEARRFLGESHLVLGDTFERRGDAASAAAQRALARDTLQPLAPTFKDRRYLFTWARVLVAVGRAGDARDVLEALRANGYRQDAIDAVTSPAHTR